MIPEPKSFLNETPELEIDASLSKAAYHRTPEVHGWKLDTELSNQNRSVYSKGIRAKVAYRGTNLKSNETWLDDLGTDFMILAGLQDKATRFKNAQRTAELAMEKYGSKNVSLTGYSLGGAQSAYVSRKTGLKATGFNPGWGLRDPLKNRTYSNFTNITTQGDVVSYLGQSSKKMKQVHIPTTALSTHSIENFIGYEYPQQDIVMSSAYSYTPREWIHESSSSIPQPIHS